MIAVAVGGAAGAVCRYLTGLAAARFSAFWPLGTFFSNCAGCFIIGFFMMLALNRIDLGAAWRLLIVTGFCGGLTTFSSYSYETIRLAQSAGLPAAVVNAAANMIAGFALTAAGMWLADKI